MGRQCPCRKRERGGLLTKPREEGKATRLRPSTGSSGALLSPTPFSFRLGLVRTTARPRAAACRRDALEGRSAGRSWFRVRSRAPQGRGTPGRCHPAGWKGPAALGRCWLPQQLLCQRGSDEMSFAFLKVSISALGCSRAAFPDVAGRGLRVGGTGVCWPCRVPGLAHAAQSAHVSYWRVVRWSMSPGGDAQSPGTGGRCSLGNRGRRALCSLFRVGSPPPCCFCSPCNDRGAGCHEDIRPSGTLL